MPRAWLVLEATLAEISTRVGFTSVYAFATAFRPEHGEAPGRWPRLSLGGDAPVPPGHAAHPALA